MPKAKPKTRRKPGRPTVYDAKRTPELARALAQIGHTELDIARYMGITVKTFARWKNTHEEFRHALKGGKAPVDDKVEKSLLQRAMGYEYEETTIIGKPGPNGTIVPHEIKKVKKQKAPNVTAQIFWLKNRRPREWRDVYRQELTGADGKSLTDLILEANKGF